MGDMISAVLFDIGGVLVALDGMPSLARLMDGKKSYDAIHELWMTCPAVVAHETGKISAEEFAVGVTADLNLPVTAHSFLRDFCAWPRAVHPGTFQLLEDIPRQYQVAALSNTSAVHWNRIVEMGLAERFQLTYLSHETGYLKPAREAFLVALKGLALAPSAVLFLDDGSANVKAARALGMPAHLASNPQEARAVLEEYGVLAHHS
jgi:HAD superfamily hydrolase (TIGR01509 family)